MVGRYWIALLASGCADFAGIGDPAPLQPDAPEVPCIVGGLDLCLFARPQTELSIDVDLKIDTTRDCNLVIYAPPAPSVCVIYASDIKIKATVTANGSRALVFAASNSIEVTGSVDVSAYRALGNNPAGANDPSCTSTEPNGYGNGAGGSFAGKGGNGGAGVGGTGSNAGGIAGPAVPRPANVRGGCSGGSADSGGGVWLAAGTEIRLGATGRVLANGAGGRGDFDFGGYGGGGSGGMIRIAAPHVVLAGMVTANGGGGAEGVDGSSSGDAAANGADGTIGSTRASGGGGTSAGGDGGAGAAGTALDGLPGTNATGTAAATGGGGGGGAGFIHLEAAAIENMATISPPPSS